MEVKLIHGADTINRKLEIKRKEKNFNSSADVDQEPLQGIENPVTEYKILDRKPFRPVNNVSHRIRRSETFTNGRTGMDNWMAELKELRKRDEVKPIEPVPPRWQTLWENDFKRKPINQKHRIKSVSAPNLLEPSSSITNIENKQKGKRKDKMRKSRYYRNGFSPISDDEKENEKFDKTSVKSTQVDEDYMLHKTCARSNNLCEQTRRLWNLDGKRTSRFMSHDAYIKDVNIKERELIHIPKDSKFKHRQRRFIRVKALDDYY